MRTLSFIALSSIAVLEYPPLIEAQVKTRLPATLDLDDEDMDVAGLPPALSALPPAFDDDFLLDDDDEIDSIGLAGPGAGDTAATTDDEVVIRTGPMEEGCVDKNQRFEGIVLTDFIPLVKSSRQCQNVCQLHPECSYFSFYAGQSPADLDTLVEGDEIQLRVATASLSEDVEADPEMDTLPTAEDVLADPQAGSCFMFGPYVKTIDAQNFESAPRACPTECSVLYSENCRTTKCCSRPTATCVLKDSFFAQCRLPTDACPGRSWECRNSTYYAQGCLEYDIDYAPTAFGNDVEEILDVPSELSCQQLCKNHPKCNYWSYNPWYKQMCLLKKRAMPKRRSKGIISGRKSCIGMEIPTLTEWLKLNEVSFGQTLKFIEAAGLTEDLSSDAPTRSIFIPTDTAWKKVSEKLRDGMMKNQTLAKDILTTHILPSVIYPERVIGTRSFAAVTASNGFTIALSRRASDGDILRINDAEILTSDYPLKGFLVSTIDNVLLPNYVIEMLDDEAEFGGSLSTPKKPTTRTTSRTPKTTTSDPRAAAKELAAARLAKQRAAREAAALAMKKAQNSKVTPSSTTSTKSAQPEDEATPSTKAASTPAPKAATTPAPKVMERAPIAPTVTEEVETEKVETEKVETERVETEKVETEKVETEKVETEKVEITEVETEKVDVEESIVSSESMPENGGEEPLMANAIEEETTSSTTDAPEAVVSTATSPILQIRVTDWDLTDLEKDDDLKIQVVKDLKTGIADSLLVQPEQVKILSLAQGSIIAEFEVTAAQDNMQATWAEAVQNPSSPINSKFQVDASFPAIAPVAPEPTPRGADSADESDDAEGMPVWLQALIGAVLALGLLACIAGFVLYRMRKNKRADTLPQATQSTRVAYH